MNKLEEVVGYLDEPTQLPIGEAAAAVETAERHAVILAAATEQALGIATDPNVTQREAGEAVHLLAGFSALNGAIHTHQPEEEPTEALGTETESLWDSLSPEQHEKAFKSRAAMAEKYAEYGVTEADFDVLRTTGEDGEDIFIMGLTADKGIDLGDDRNEGYDSWRSWNSIDPENPNENFMIEVDGQKIDTRAAVTMTTLWAMVEHNPNINNECVWRTGEKELADDLNAPVGIVHSGQVVERLSSCYSGFRGLRLRTAVVI